MITPEILSMVPARGGSKGIPRKNIRLFGGYPLIAYSISAAVQARTLNSVIVSIDDPEIAEPYNIPRQQLPGVYLQTGHVNAIRPTAILGGSMTGTTILPIIIDGR